MCRVPINQFALASLFASFWFLVYFHFDCTWKLYLNSDRPESWSIPLGERGRRQLTSCLCDCCRWMASIVVNRAQIKIVTQSETETGTAYADDDEVIYMYSMYIPYCLVVRIYVCYVSITFVRPSSSIARHQRISLFNFFQLPFS